MRPIPFMIFAIPLTVLVLVGIGLWAADALPKKPYSPRVDYTCPREVGDMELLSFKLAWDNQTQTDCRYVRKGKRS